MWYTTYAVHTADTEADPTTIRPITDWANFIGELNMKTCNLFISHSWTHSDKYDDLWELLEDRSYFVFQDYSIPKDDPIHTEGSDKELSDAIYWKMRPCSVMLVLAGVSASYSKWIPKEIAIAKTKFASPKPIIAVEYWGSKRSSEVVKNSADRIVKWNTNSIVDAIRKVRS